MHKNNSCIPNFLCDLNLSFTPLLEKVEASVDSKIELENFVMIECSESFVKMFYMNKKYVEKFFIIEIP